MQFDWHLPENTRIGRSAVGVLFSSHMRAGSHWAHVTEVKESGDAVWSIMLRATSSSMTGLVSNGLGRNVNGGLHRPQCLKFAVFFRWQWYWCHWLALTFPRLESNWEPLGYYVSEHPMLLWWTSCKLDQPVTLVFFTLIFGVILNPALSVLMILVYIDCCHI